MADTPSSILDRVKGVIAQKLDVDIEKLTPATRIAEDLGADSLEQAEMAMELEEEFEQPGKKLEIPDDDAKKLATVGDIVKYIESKLGAPPNAAG